MAKAIKYKRQRKLNWVSITLILAALFIAYLISQYLPLYFRKQEAYRVLDETSSQFAGRKNRYLANDDQMIALQRRMENDLRLIGVTDPDMESWIEVDNKNTVRFGVIYSETISWPYDVIEPQTEEVELEYTLTLTW